MFSGERPTSKEKRFAGKLERPPALGDRLLPDPANHSAKPAPRSPPKRSSSENNLLPVKSIPDAWPYSIQPGESPTAPSTPGQQQQMTFRELNEETQSNEYTKGNRSHPFAGRQPVRLLQTIVPQRRR